MQDWECNYEANFYGLQFEADRLEHLDTCEIMAHKCLLY